VANITQPAPSFAEWGDNGVMCPAIPVDNQPITFEWGDKQLKNGVMKKE
jgi:hypothetical protein